MAVKDQELNFEGIEQRPLQKQPTHTVSDKSQALVCAEERLSRNSGQ